MKLQKKSKKVILTLVVCLTLLLLMPQAAFADDGLKLSAGSESGAVDGEVSVSVSVENAAGTEGGQFELSFDSGVVKPVGIEKGSFVSNAANDQFNYNLEYDSGKLMVIWVTPKADTSDAGVVCTIDFELLAEGNTSLTFGGVVVAPDGAIVAAAHSSGTITVDEDDAEEAKQKAIDDANAAIAALPEPADITLAHKSDVVAARALVNKAISDHGAVDADFDDLDKLEEAEKMIAKHEAIKAADDAIVALPSLDDLSLDDKPAVVAARALVNKAISDHGAVDGDFTYLSILSAAENRIKELEGLVPTPPTGGMGYAAFGGLLLAAIGVLFYIKRNQMATVK